MSQQFNVRLPDYTRQQIDELSTVYGLTKTQVVMLAIDRFARVLADDDTDEQSIAQKDIRRIKTVARIAPHVDAGQDGFTEE